MAISRHSPEQRSRKTEASLKEAKKNFKKFENFENAIFLKKFSSKNARTAKRKCDHRHRCSDRSGANTIVNTMVEKLKFYLQTKIKNRYYLFSEENHFKISERQFAVGLSKATRCHPYDAQ